MQHRWKRVAASTLLSMSLLLTNCAKPETPAPAPVEPEALSRTEFTKRVENYFEYEPLRHAKPSPVRIHLTDLSDGSPVEKAEVSLTVRPKGSAETAVQTTRDRKSTRLNSSHSQISYAVFCLKKK